MTVLTEGMHEVEYLIHEQDVQISRATGTLITGQNLKSGTILGLITSSGKWTQLDQDASDGSEVARAILYHSVDATSADKACVVHQYDVVANALEVIWPSDIDAGEKTTAIGELWTNSKIVLRDASTASDT